MWTRVSVCAVVLGIVLAGCAKSTSEPTPVAALPPDPATLSAQPPDDGTLSPLAVRAADLMRRLESTPDHMGLHGAFWEVVLEIYRAEWPNLDTPTNRVYAQALQTAYAYADAGDGSFLEAIMMASFGPYGETAEGAEGFTEMLWALFERNPTLTIAVLAEVSPEDRQRLVDEVYTVPPHEYDFATIVDALQSEWPAEVAPHVHRIITELALLSGASDASTPGASSLTDAEALQLAQLAQELLGTWEDSATASKSHKQFFAAFDRLYGSTGWVRFSPDTTTAAGRILVQVGEHANAGRPEFVRALMRATQGPYGSTMAEGGEWTNELCWIALEHGVDATLAVLADMSPDERKVLLETVYLQPVHDSFDFLGIERALRDAKAPAGMEEGLQRMLAVVEVAARQIAPPDARLHVKRGAAAAKRGRRHYKEAVEEYRLAIELAPYWPDPHYALGRVFKKHGDNFDALASFTAYLELQPHITPRRLTEVQTYIRALEKKLAPPPPPPPPPAPVEEEPAPEPMTKQEPAAEEVAPPEPASDPDPVPAEARRHVERAAAAAKRGPEGYYEAIEEYGRAIELAPDWPDPHFGLGLVYVKYGPTADAIASFERYLEMEPDETPRSLNQIRLMILKLKDETGAAAPAPAPPAG